MKAKTTTISDNIQKKKRISCKKNSKSIAKKNFAIGKWNVHAQDRDPWEYLNLLRSLKVTKMKMKEQVRSHNLQNFFCEEEGKFRLKNNNRLDDLSHKESHSHSRPKEKFHKKEDHPNRQILKFALKARQRHIWHF
jgi:hypothetical protein